MKSPFRIAVITDEITQDFGRALEVARKEFEMGWVEVRTMWSRNITRLDAKEIAEARRLLEHFRLRVTDIASPLFKVDWPGAPRSPHSPPQPDGFGANFTFEQQDELLERCCELARAFRTDRIRCFDFWRLEDQQPYRAAIDQKLREATAKAGKKNVILVLENEHACNTATVAEALRTLDAVRSPHLMLTWDPANAVMAGDAAQPNSYDLLPKNRVGHVHCKNLERRPGGTGYQWTAMGRGVIDWTGQFRALARDGYRGAVSLETHWRGAGTPEQSSRQCWAEMKEQLRRAEAVS
jgi:sugar phosphate isomerase/epimerase